MLSLIPEVPAFDTTNNIFGNKFLRRPDLTVFDRVQIAYEALCAKIFGLWGTISALALLEGKNFLYSSQQCFHLCSVQKVYLRLPAFIISPTHRPNSSPLCS
jgi:hypothetical protein